MSQSPSSLPLTESHQRMTRSGKQRLDEFQLQATAVPIVQQQQQQAPPQAPPTPSGVVLASANEVEGAQLQIAELSGALEKIHAQMDHFNKRIMKLEEKLNTFSKKSTKPATPAEKKKRNEIRKFFKDKTVREDNLLQEIRWVEVFDVVWWVTWTELN